MSTISSQITNITIVYSTVYSGAAKRRHQSSASLAFVRESADDRWIVRTKGQQGGKCFHLMTSSWGKWNETRTTRTPAFWDTPATPWLSILMIHIRSQVKTRQSQSYKSKKNTINSNFARNLHTRDTLWGQPIIWDNDGLLPIKLDHKKLISMKFYLELKTFHSTKCIWRCRLQKWRPSCLNCNVSNHMHSRVLCCQPTLFFS